jgi:hypothetical protein
VERTVRRKGWENPSLYGRRGPGVETFRPYISFRIPIPPWVYCLWTKRASSLASSFISRYARDEDAKRVEINLGSSSSSSPRRWIIFLKFARNQSSTSPTGTPPIQDNNPLKRSSYFAAARCVLLQLCRSANLRAVSCQHRDI